MIAGRVAAAPGYTQRRVETHEQVGRDGMEGACNTLYPPVHPPSRARARYGSGSGFLVSVSWLAVARNHGWRGWAVERCINGGDT